jgi:undecaprenyl-diphosphatase
MVVVGSLLATALAVGTMKLAFGRTAPSSGEDVFGTSALSYPSGHAVNTVIIWTLVLRILVGLYGDQLSALRTPARRALLVAMVAAACGVSMVGLNYHWFTDVLAGWLVGVAISLLAPSPLPLGFVPESAAATGAGDPATPDGSRQGPGRPVPSG